MNDKKKLFDWSLVEVVLVTIQKFFYCIIRDAGPYSL